MHETLTKIRRRLPKRFSLCLCVSVVNVLLFISCTAERRKSDAELGLTQQQSAGRRIYDDNCARCHEPYSSSGKQGPSLQGIFKKPYFEMSGLPANDARATDIIRFGRDKMTGFGRVLSQQQTNDLLAYLHTL
jgi:mono/diheme cytochrome c family protein